MQEVCKEGLLKNFAFFMGNHKSSTNKIFFFEKTFLGLYKIKKKTWINLLSSILGVLYS